jgi:protein-L-isoaspartate(D-aspartate) O-methyltransferase
MVDYGSEKEGFAALLLRLRALGVDDTRLLTAFENVPRSVFLNPELRHLAYSSKMLPIDCGGFCESIDVTVRLFSQLDIQPHHKVLDLGCGSGFAAAVLSRLCERVLTIDRFKTHVSSAMIRFEHIGLTNMVVKQLDGSDGVQGEGTFDRIYSTASFTDMPRHYVDHLTTEGVMIAPLSMGNGRAKMMRLTKIGSRFEREDLFEIADNPLISGLAAAL